MYDTTPRSYVKSFNVNEFKSWISIRRLKTGGTSLMFHSPLLIGESSREESWQVS